MSPRVYNDSIWAVLINFDTDFFTTASHGSNNIFTMHGKLFLIEKVSRTQSDAQAYCQSLHYGNAGSQKLFEPQSKEETDDVISKVDEIGGHHYYWIGADISEGLSPNHCQYQSNKNPVPFIDELYMTLLYYDPGYCICIASAPSLTYIWWERHCQTSLFSICEMTF